MSTLQAILVWVALLVLLVAECMLARFGSLRGLVPFVGVGMAIVVAFTFMHLAGGRGLIPIAAVVGAFWLCVMLGLGSLDPATRHDVFTSIGIAPSR